MSAELGPLFSVPARLHRGGRDEAKFWEWFRANPRAFARIVEMAREAKRRGRSIGMRFIVEFLRWNSPDVEQTDESYRINDHVCPYVARYIEREFADLRGYFELRDRSGAAS